jgi:hypothetical protein
LTPATATDRTPNEASAASEGSSADGRPVSPALPEIDDAGAATRAVRLQTFGIAAAIVVAHVLMFFAMRGGLLLSKEPLTSHDFDTHIQQTWRVLEGIEGWGQTWVYDPRMLAGNLEGVIFDADNKAWELWTWALWRMGVAKGFAFNSFAIVAHLLVPFVAWWTARLFGFSRGAALATMGMWCGIWWFEAFSHFCWFVGMISYGFAAYLALLPLALFHRFLQTRSAWIGVVCALVMGIAHNVHPYTFIALVVPMTAMYGFEARRLGWAMHLGVFGIAGTTILMNLWWLVPSLSFWHYVLDSAYFGQPRLLQIPADFLGLMIDGTVTGMVRPTTTWRWAALMMAAMMFAAWRVTDVPAARPLRWLIVWTFLLAYLGGLTIAAQTQPYRYILPMSYGAGVAAGAAIARALAAKPWRSATPTVRGLLVVLGVLAGLRASDELLYYGHRAFPRPAPVPDGSDSPLNILGHVYSPGGRYHDDHGSLEEIREFIAGHDDGQSRWLVELPARGEHLAWSTKAHILGGFTWRNTVHSDANFFRRFPRGISDTPQLRRYVKRYGVRWIVVTKTGRWWDAHGDLLKKVAEFDTTRIYEVQDRAKFPLFAKNRGRVSVQTNRIRVKGTKPDEPVQLRFHWFEGLRCRPDCEIEQMPLHFDRAGFIEIPAPHPADFVIENVYPPG